VFDKILIANRGEIACRIMRTAHRMGLRCVAVYSEADAGARHVRLADEAVLVGPAAARESYLAGAKIIAAARQTGAQAIHPGYGFLSENADFAAACAAAGLVFIGPPATAIRAMGSKSAAKALMESAGVPTTPGYHGDNQDLDTLRRQAEAIGYPVLIKASAGGGGKGMRRVDRAADFAAALAGCQREATAAFGDARVLIEKYLTRPRHIELQVFGDSHGNYVHLFERDCSVQRRHQKVLEEAPAPGMSTERRAAMGQAAVEAARAVGYVGAGTVEFIVAPDGRFYFMEMNTRLQVEHPVTEMITGLDLVEWQLRVAAGEPLPLAQEQVQLRGHAVEARIYAEDPERDFLPASGNLLHLAPPLESPYLRVDSGVDAGDQITPHYDPMIAKLIVWDDAEIEPRRHALARMQQALADYRIAGVANNVEFLARLVACPAFANADLDTGLIERERAYLFPAEPEVPRLPWLLAALAELLFEMHLAADAAALDGDRRSPWHRRDAWRLNGSARRFLQFRCREDQRRIEVNYAEGGFVLVLDASPSFVRGDLRQDGTLHAEIDGLRLSATVIATGERRHVFAQGRTWTFAAVDPLFATSEGVGGHGQLVAPMPGKVVALLAEPGARVNRGAPLLILEAMKMEHTIAAPADGTVKKFRYGIGDQVGDGAELVEFEPAQ
jgi:3-methylcrotonyl-CoA carboxylase alpha subunit